jgi:hypothetical protein
LGTVSPSLSAVFLPRDLPSFVDAIEELEGPAFLLLTLVAAVVDAVAVPLAVVVEIDALDLAGAFRLGVVVFFSDLYILHQYTHIICKTHPFLYPSWPSKGPWYTKNPSNSGALYS